MHVPWTLVAAWSAFTSLVACVLALHDKARARRGGRRVPERVLLLWAAAGGTPGLLAAMLAVHHKTSKPRFLARLLLVLLLQFALLAWLAHAMPPIPR